MKAREKMAKRVALYNKLVDIDQRIKLRAGQPTGRITVVDLLNARAKVCVDLIASGFEPWPVDSEMRM